MADQMRTPGGMMINIHVPLFHYQLVLNGDINFFRHLLSSFSQPQGVGELSEVSGENVGELSLDIGH
jgi:hypothetical protein